MKNSTLHLKLTFFLLVILSVLQVNATVYEVGPGKTYTSLTQVPTHNLQPGDIVKVFYKATPYYEKILLHGIGTVNNPITLIGIADANGNKPVLDGNNALSNTSYNYWNEDRQVILIGQFGAFQSDHIIVDGFEIRGANNLNTYTNDQGNSGSTYASNANGIRVSSGKTITIRNCEIHGNGSGIQSGNGDDLTLTVEYCSIYDNGVCSWYNSFIHNLYLSSGLNSSVTVQYCHIGELLSNGQQVRSRAETTVIRYNWIEGGRNSSLDLVQASYSETNAADAYVYGNIIIKPDNAQNSRIVHFGSDNSNFRLGTCFFYNNTCIIKDTKTFGSRRIFNLSGNVSTIIADNNIFYKDDAVTYNLMSGTSNLSGTNNWFSTNINGINTLTNSLSDSTPNFVDYAIGNFDLQANSPCFNVVTNYTYPTNYDLTQQYVKHLQNITRPVNGTIDLGAMESNASLSINEFSVIDLKVFPNPTSDYIHISYNENIGNIKSVFLIDVTGKHVKTFISNRILNVSTLNPGIYFLNLCFTNKQCSTKKIIIK